ALVNDNEHPLLRFTEHDLVAGHARRALRDLVELDLDARPGARGGLTGGTGQSRCAHVLDAGDRAGGQQFEAGFAHELLHEWIAHLHRATLHFGGFLGQVLRGKRRTREPVAPGRRADVEHRVPDALSLPAHDLLVAQHAEAKGVNQRIALVRLVEIDLTRNGRNAEAIAVMRDARDHAAEEATVIGNRCCVLRVASRVAWRWRLFARPWTVFGDRAAAQGVDRADRPGAHREDVADDAADPGRRALKRLNRARVIVRLDLERNGQAVADVDDTGVLLAGADQDFWRLRREGLEQRAGVLVGAV